MDGRKTGGSKRPLAKKVAFTETRGGPGIKTGYRFMTHRKLIEAGAEKGSIPGEDRDLALLLHELATASVGRYDYVLSSTPEFSRWFLSRPGMSEDTCFVALASGKIVSSILLTVTPILFSGELMRAGLIDSVMTHPDHRRRGLARELLNRAVACMAELQLDLSLLYTVAESMPYHFYASLGYRDSVRVQLLKREAVSIEKAGRPDWRASGPSETKSEEGFSSLAGDPAPWREVLDRAFHGHGSYIPMTEELWKWRRQNRPSSAPVDVYTLGESHRNPATFASSRVWVRKGGEPLAVTVISDVAVQGRAFDRELVECMMSVLLPDRAVLVFCPEVNEGEIDAYTEAGFAPVSVEACMIKPLSESGVQSLQSKPALWYTVTESVVGV